ncbi:hypothetical protein HYH03_005865 [Edaphochlamys debaryana]|uniref:Uncharacterized protein n=1 Tax=Edaphochlamys debaryana TaxID=47281 RepID=A0A835YE46_9CHLO|nr:hypothetical protein HYH03_005865 [Edaphochlamys debaryana]|eukprot:KAG2495934.1 hypothetical protein HYH03_005865 [Edaphochlamys debaryana]
MPSQACQASQFSFQTMKPEQANSTDARREFYLYCVYDFALGSTIAGGVVLVLSLLALGWFFFSRPPLPGEEGGEGAGKEEEDAAKAGEGDAAKDPDAAAAAAAEQAAALAAGGAAVALGGDPAAGFSALGAMVSPPQWPVRYGYRLPDGSIIKPGTAAHRAARYMVASPAATAAAYAAVRNAQLAGIAARYGGSYGGAPPASPGSGAAMLMASVQSLPTPLSPHLSAGVITPHVSAQFPSGALLHKSPSAAALMARSPVSGRSPGGYGVGGSAPVSPWGSAGGAPPPPYPPPGPGHYSAGGAPPPPPGVDPAAMPGSPEGGAEAYGRAGTT